jgi:DMSO/TMAO reductase YedYZ molybdopterin-dependent catalytic subunit
MTPRPRDERSLIDRRRFLALAATGAATALIGCDSFGSPRLEPALAAAQRGNEKVERLLFRHRSEDRIPGGARLSGNAFPQYYVSDTVPMWDEATRGVWRLEVSGAVRHPLSLGLDDLVRMRRVAQSVDHFCVEGWTARAQWIGVRVSDLARAAGITDDAQYVDFQSFDSDYHESWDMASAMHPQTLVAYAMDVRYLGAGHGAPARVHSPVKLGYKNTKYLTKVVFMPQRNGGYWTDRGYEWYAGT